MTRTCRVFAFLAAVLLAGSVAWAQSSGSFSYGTDSNSIASGNANGVVGCVMDSNGTITGGGTCTVSSAGTCPEDTFPATCTPGAAGDTACSTAFGEPSMCTATNTCKLECAPGSPGNTDCAADIGNGSICVADATSATGGFCSTTACEFFTCTTNTDCLDIYGLNSGATCVNNVCQLPATSFPGSCMGSATAGLKTNSGNGNVFDIRPSAVIGLLTDVTVTSKQQAAAANNIALSAALAGIDFKIEIDPLSGQSAPSLTPNGAITYDARFVQISTNLFNALSGGCLANAGGCFITFAESTVSAHSFDWIAGSTFGGGTPLSSGEYNIKADWMPSIGFGLVANSIGEAMACVGPVNLTVSQNKIFHFNAVNGF